MDFLDQVKNGDGSPLASLGENWEHLSGIGDKIWTLRGSGTKKAEVISRSRHGIAGMGNFMSNAAHDPDNKQ
jgi:hypothetical protein